MINAASFLAVIGSLLVLDADQSLGDLAERTWATTAPSASSMPCSLGTWPVTGVCTMMFG
jgi:hypothetical protein